jgi:hypothetical protein
MNRACLPLIALLGCAPTDGANPSTLWIRATNGDTQVVLEPTAPVHEF